ncbi:MAG TPA: putative dsRNA-binding protein, partial [Bryobacteraceae bacterium]|nr:putative dsRNA-binding protein [Bryobacteraceae bacterium]
IMGAEKDLAESTAAPFTNFKGALQETARTLNLPPPRYAVVSEQGPAHARRYTVEVRVGTAYSARAEGDSKKGAGQKAAEAVLTQLLEHVE